MCNWTIRKEQSINTNTKYCKIEIFWFVDIEF